MSASATTALGIDIGGSQISLVLLGKTKEGLRVLNAAQVPISAGTIKGGRVVDEASLLTALKSIKRRHKTRTKHVALSLPGAGTVTRVIPMDEKDPQRIAQLVHREIKEYAAFSGRETVSDFRVVTPARPNTPGKVFLSAADHQTVVTVMRVCRRVGLGVSAIESAGVACVRAAGSRRPLGRSTGHRLWAVLKDGSLNCFVFRRGVLDFVRSARSDALGEGPEGIQAPLTDRINAIIGFYEGQDEAMTEPWSVTIVDDDDVVVGDDAERFVKDHVRADAVAVRARAHFAEEMGLDSPGEGTVSIAALGLAMRFLVDDEGSFRVNLLLPEAARAKSTRTHVLIAANTLAIMIFIVVLIMGGLRLMTKRVNQNIVAMSQAELKRGQHGLSAAAHQLVYIEQRCESLSRELASLKRSAESHLDVHWTQLLDDIKRATPAVLCVTNLTVDAGSDLSMEGLSHSYEAVHMFVEMLNRSEQIRKASVVETGRSTTEDGLVRYIVTCTLVSGKAV